MPLPKKDLGSALGAGIASHFLEVLCSIGYSLLSYRLAGGVDGDAS